MFILGMPSPLLWGMMAAIFNFVPYLGAVCTFATIGFVSFVSFNQWNQIIPPPLVFLALTALEGQLISPTILGSRLSINPIILFLHIFFMGWIWGTPGVLISLPLLAIFRIVIINIEGGKKIADIFA